MSDDRDILQTRKAKMATWMEQTGGFRNDFRRSDSANALHKKCTDLDKAALEEAQIPAAVCGRIMLRRVMGKASFITLQDVDGQMQCYLSKNDLGEHYDHFTELSDIGDIVGVRGVMMRTNKGELSVHAQEFILLNKTLRPLPEKFHGVSDQEIRYRQRYLDLMTNPASRQVFLIRSQIVQKIREFFVGRDYLEVETPMMHAIPGGATARPFVTHHNALDMALYLRIAPELFLKRLVVGGYERVFEINRNFRNEGLSTRHNPEFTMLEFYQAYADYRDLMDLTDELFRMLATDVIGATKIEYQGLALDLAETPRRLTMAESLVEYAGVGESQVDNESALRDELNRLNLAVDEAWGLGKLADGVV